MKKVILLLTTIVSLISCQFTEELYINENGSGKMSVKFDGSSAMQMMAAKFKEDSSDKKEVKLDTIFDFKELLTEMKDSIATLPKEQQQRLKALENFKMHMLMDPEALKMDFDMFTDFNSLNELDNLFSNFQKGASLVKTKNKLLNSKNSPAVGNSKSEKKPSSKVEYSFTKNVFKRATTILDKEKLKREKDSLAPMQAFLGTSKYTLKYHFPKRIKKTSSEKALFSQDGKTLTLETSFIEYMANPKSLDIEVELEN